MDLENPNFRQNSICSIGVILVRDNKVVEKKYSLINPEDDFDYMNIQLTKIAPHMVQDSPTLKEYWNEIDYLLMDNVVVGHNITYDLKVLSKSLQRYGMPIPEFDYCCTLSLSRRNLKLPSYKLENIAKKLHIIYNPHNAIEDARAAYELFEHINRKKEVSSDQCNHYVYRYTVNEKYDPKLSTNINNLYGMIRVLLFEEAVSEAQFNLLKDWFDNNKKYNQYLLFNNINTELNNILSKGYLSGFDKKVLSDLVDNVTQSSIYSHKTLKTQELQGIIKCITADGKVTLEELSNLKNWINRNNNLQNTYPYDSILKITDEYLKNGFITSDEQELISNKFKDLITSKKDTDEEIKFSNKNFCLSGDFINGTKDEITKLLEDNGAVIKHSVSSKVDYLVVGQLGSPGWKYGNMGGKITKAKKLQDKGEKIKIISEKNLFKSLNN